MKYIKAFMRFWYDFIVGDDWRIASTVVWGLTIVFVLVRSGFNAWFVLPLLVVASCVWSAWRANAKSQHKRQATGNRRILGACFSTLQLAPLWLPIISVAVLPLVIFRFTNNDLRLAHFLLPVLLNLAAATLLALCLNPSYRKYPFAASMIAVFMSVWLLVDRLQPKIQTFSEQVSDAQSLYRYGFTLIVAVITGLLIARLFSDRKKEQPANTNP